MLVTGRGAVGAAGSGHVIIPWLVRARWAWMEQCATGRQLGARKKVRIAEAGLRQPIIPGAAELNRIVR